MKPLIAVALVGLLAFPARAGAGADGAGSPEARQFLEEVAAAYRGLTTYADQGAFTIASRDDAAPRAFTWPMAFRIARPNRVAIDAGEVKLAADGTSMLTVIAPMKRYLTEAQSGPIRLASITEGPAGALLLGGPGGPAAGALLTLLFHEEAPEALLSGGTIARLEPDRTLDGKALKALVLDPLTGANVVLLIDPATKLVERIEIVDPDRTGPEAAEVSLVWRAGAISTGPEAEKNGFATTPPPGHRRVSELQAAAAKPAAPRHELIGRPAPEFSLNVLEAGGKTRRVTKDDLAGKVVLLDFWATWCGPCLKELPQVAELIEAYSQAGKPVVVVAISLDQEPREGTVRALVEKTITDHKLGIDKAPMGLVALDPSSAVGGVFDVEALPTAFLLDTKGTVQAVHIGAPDDVKEALQKDIDALLEGKSLIVKE